MLISFSGQKCSGKDTAAEALISRHGFKRIGLADKLKEIMSRVTGIPLEDMRAGNDRSHTVHEEVRDGGPSKRCAHFMEQKGWANSIGRNFFWDF